MKNYRVVKEGSLTMKLEELNTKETIITTPNCLVVNGALSYSRNEPIYQLKREIDKANKRKKILSSIGVALLLAGIFSAMFVGYLKDDSGYYQAGSSEEGIHYEWVE